MTNEGHFLPRIAVTKGFEIHCSACGPIGFVETRVEAEAEKRAHANEHKAGN